VSKILVFGATHRWWQSESTSGRRTSGRSDIDTDFYRDGYSVWHGLVPIFHRDRDGPKY